MRKTMKPLRMPCCAHAPVSKVGDHDAASQLEVLANSVGDGAECDAPSRFELVDPWRSFGNAPRCCSAGFERRRALTVGQGHDHIAPRLPRAAP